MEEWTCTRCGDAFFGIPPERGLCIACQEETDEPLVNVTTWPELKAEPFTGREGELCPAEEQLRNEVRAYWRHSEEGRPP